MVTSNIRDINDGTDYRDTRFYKVSGSVKDYAALAERKFSIGTGFEGHDHFIHTMRSIDNLWGKYSRSQDKKQVLGELGRNPVLKRWVAAVICMMIYGSYNGYHLKTVGYPIENNTFLRVWKNKFLFDKTYDNCPQSNSADEDTKNKFYVYEFVKNETGTAIGSFSNRYCIIPSRHIASKDNGWEELFSELIKSENLDKYINTQIPVSFRIKLKFSAYSLPENLPVMMIREFVLSAVQCDINFSEDVPYSSVGFLKLYDIENAVLSDNVLCDDIYVSKVNGKCVALYPLKKSFAEDIERNITSVEDIVMQHTHDEETSEKYTVSGKFCYKVSFKDIGQENADSFKVPYYFTDEKQYIGDNIKSADGVGTFCTYPDIPIEYEYRCKSYNYFYDLNVSLSNGGTAENLELSEVDFKQSYSGDNIYIYSSDKPIHIFKVSFCKTKYSGENRYAGCIINIHKLGNECTPPLLEEDEITSFDINSVKIEPKSTMYIYMDLGSSSSAVGYKIGNGESLLDDITGGTNIVRELIGSFDNERYSYFLNMPSLYEKNGSVPSALIEYCDKPFSDVSFDNVFLPFHRHFSKFEEKGLKICDVNKSMLANSTGTINNTLQAMIYNLFYTALCHVIASNCEEAVFIQSFPNEDYRELYHIITHHLSNHFKANVFHDLQINSVITCRNNYLLYESLAITNGISGSSMANNNLIIGIDIGDSTTDMAAVYCVNNTKTFCGYSSIEYAGKQLLKRAVFDMLIHSGSKSDPQDFERNITEFLIGNERVSGFFEPKSEENKQPLQNYASMLAKRFVSDINDSGDIESAAWENIFMEILECADINIDGCDPKIRSALLYRYAVLIPIIKDFAQTSLNACEHTDATVSLNFYGGGSKGLLLAEKFTNEFFSMINKYFGKYNISVSVKVPEGDSKQLLLKGLEKLNVYADAFNNSGADNSQLYNVHLHDTETTVTEWRYIDPRNMDYITNPLRRDKCAEYNITPLKSEDELNKNKEQRYRTANFIKNPFAELKEYVSEIEQFFIPDGNEHILVDKMNERKISKRIISKDKNSSFMRAANADVYPEMIHNAVYLFEVGRIISESF